MLHILLDRGLAQALSSRLNALGAGPGVMRPRRRLRSDSDTSLPGRLGPARGCTVGPGSDRTKWGNASGRLDGRPKEGSCGGSATLTTVAASHSWEAEDCIAGTSSGR
eukprot:751800-Hanusia_phi.AAC.2